MWDPSEQTEVNQGIPETPGVSGATGGAYSTATPLGLSGPGAVSSAGAGGTTSPSMPGGSSSPTRLFSPSQTDDFARCPVYWDLGRRWERGAGNAWSPERLIGDSIHAGLAAHYRELGMAMKSGLPTDAALKYLTEGWPADAPFEFTIEAAESFVRKGMTEGLKLQAEVLADQGAVIAVEHDFGESIVDLVTIHGDGYLAVTDWKYNHSVKGEWINERLAETERLHGLYHYAWRAQEKWRLSVRFIRKGLIVGSPKTVARLASVEINPAIITGWHIRTQGKWRVMEAMRKGTLPIYQNPHACKLFGGCSYYDGCWKLGLDESRFETLYVRKVWKDDWKKKR